MENSFTIGISAGVFGTRYTKFIPQWWESIARLNIQPDAIVFLYDKQNEEPALSQIPERYKPITKFIEFSGEDFGEFRHLSQMSQETDWVSVIGIDDQYLPEAFDEIEQAELEGCDIYIDKIQFKHNGELMEGRFIPEELPSRITCPGAAPIKLDLYKRTGGVSKGTIWDDWELYLRCAAVGAKPYHANTIRIIHDLGFDHETLSGVNRNPENDRLGAEQMARVRKELGL